MTETQTFIEEAIKGRWTPNDIYQDFHPQYAFWVHWVLLQPQAWQAVGRTRGWKADHIDGFIYKGPDWKPKWHRFIDALSDGKTIEEALVAIK